MFVPDKAVHGTDEMEGRERRGKAGETLSRTHGEGRRMYTHASSNTHTHTHIRARADIGNMEQKKKKKK